MEKIKWLEELSRKARNRLILKTLQTYPLDWIVIHEALQNAIDAVRRGKKKDKIVTIEIDPNENCVVIFDNGIGFPFNLSLLGFGESDKKDELGEIGVGLKVILVSSKEFFLEAIYKDKDNKFKKWSCKISDGYKIITGEKEDLEVEYEKPKVVDEENTYTQIRYVLHENEIVNWLENIYEEYIDKGRVFARLADSLQEKFKIALEHYFRTTGYAADVLNLIKGSGDVKIHLKIVPLDRKISLSKPLKEILSNGIEIKFENKYWDVKEIVRLTKKGFIKPIILTHSFPDDGGNIGNYTEKYIYIQKFTRWSSIKKLLTNTRIRDQPNLNYFSRFIRKYVNGIYLLVGSRDTLKEYLINFPRMHIISSCGTPSTHEIHSPRGVGFLGYLNNIFLIVDLKERLTYGKQTIRNPRILGYVNEFFREAFRTTLRVAAQSIVGIRERVGEPPSIIVSEQVIMSRESIQPSILSIKKSPQEEIEVIAIFYELIGKGILKEYETWALSTRLQYDGKIMIYPPSKPVSQPRSDRDLNTVEFKVNLSSLINDFDNGDKFLDEINLVVVWKDDFHETYRRGHAYYEVIPIKGTELEELNLPYIKKCIHDRRTAKKLPILELNEIIRILAKELS